jgi:SAM-dependent methyltransferase
MYTAAFRQEASRAYGIEVEMERAREAAGRASGVAQAVGERLPFADGAFDIVFSHEVLEHTDDDRRSAVEMARVTRAGGRIVIFVPNRLYPFETHGIFWRGRYRFGNIPLVNYLPDPLRRRLAPHVRAYTARALRRLFADLPVRVVYHTGIFPGYDKLAARSRFLAWLLRGLTYALEKTPLRAVGLSHFLVLERA